MNYHNITTDDMKNGDGLRVVLWVSGCAHFCEGCQNPVTWDPDDGIPFDENALNEIRNQLNKPYISGLTLSGGDPLYCGNRKDILDLIMTIKSEYPDKTIWLYTGYTRQSIRRMKKDDPCHKILANINVLVDGEFVEELKDNTLEWVGSSNQHVIRLR